MALAGVLVNKEIENKFKELGVKDSKLLTSEKREELAKKIKEQAITFYVALTHANEIDSKIKTGTNLNKVEAEKAAEIINNLTKETEKPIKVIIDCPSPNKESWRKDVLRKVNRQENLLVACEHKADRDYIAVSAASILAKSAREKEISILKKKIGKDFGSGYPNDPKTIKFLKKYSEEHKKDGIFRETWATFKNLKKEKQQKKLREF
jgi:ribonuclease HII